MCIGNDRLLQAGHSEAPNALRALPLCRIAQLAARDMERQVCTRDALRTAVAGEVPHPKVPLLSAAGRTGVSVLSKGLYTQRSAYHVYCR